MSKREYLAVQIWQKLMDHIKIRKFAMFDSLPAPVYTGGAKAPMTSSISESSSPSTVPLPTLSNQDITEVEHSRVHATVLDGVTLTVVVHTQVI